MATHYLASLFCLLAIAAAVKPKVKVIGDVKKQLLQSRSFSHKVQQAEHEFCPLKNHPQCADFVQDAMFCLALANEEVLTKLRSSTDGTDVVVQTCKKFDEVPLPQLSQLVMAPVSDHAHAKPARAHFLAQSVMDVQRKVMSSKSFHRKVQK